MSALPLYAVDIETDTTFCPTHQGCCGLNPQCAAITDIVIKGDAVAVVLDDADGEDVMLTRFWHLMHGLPRGVVVTWNGACFDNCWLDSRSRKHGQRSPVCLSYDPTIPVKYEPTPGYRGGCRATYGPHQHADIQHYFKPIAEKLGVKHALKPVAEALLGYAPIVVDREKMHLLTPQERYDYAVSDGQITLALAQMIPADVFAGMIDVVDPANVAWAA